MQLPQAIAAVRAALDDMGTFLTFTNQADAANQNTLHVADTSQLQPGAYLLLGSGTNVEGHLVVAASTTSGNGALTLATPLVNASATNTPVGSPLERDEAYTDSITKAIAEYTKFRPLLKRYPNGGLAIVAGQDTYTLPADFIAPDQASFDAAVGLTSSLSATGGTYALVYDASNQFSTSGFGSSMNFGPSPWYGFAPINGNPFNNPNMGMFPQSGPQTFTFVRSNTPTLTILPAPTMGATYDFFYQAPHVAPALGVDTTVPPDDIYLVWAWAKYLRCEALATIAASQATSEKVGDVEISRTRTPQFYRDAAKAAKDEFDRQMRMVPNGLAG